MFCDFGAVAVGDGYALPVGASDEALAEGLDIADVCDKRAVDAHESFGGESFLSGFHAHQCQHRALLAGDVDFDIVFEAFDI